MVGDIRVTSSIGTSITNYNYTYGNTNWGDLLTNYNGTAITYDAIGNPLKWRNANQLLWQGRNLTVFQHTDGNYSAYTYNADGIRTQKSYINAEGTVGEVTAKYTLDGNRIVAEQRGDTMLYYLYDENGSIMGISYGYDTYTFAKNIQGDVIGIYSGGTLVAKYEYSAYGQILSITNASGTDISNNATHIANLNPFRYRGYYYDTETGFYYLQTRYYDPVVGRFLNADAFVSTGQGIIGNNMFAYCNNNPVFYADNNGCDPIPAWAQRIVDGEAKESDYIIAWQTDPIHWAGHAGYIVRKAIAIVKEERPELALFAEHHKKGTTNQANKQKHEDGQARKQRDNRGEKGDARRYPNPNKRRPNNTSKEITFGERMLCLGTSLLCVGGIIYVTANDVTVVGVADDGLLATLIPAFSSNFVKIFA